MTKGNEWFNLLQDPLICKRMSGWFLQFWKHAGIFSLYCTRKTTRKFHEMLMKLLILFAYALFTCKHQMLEHAYGHCVHKTCRKKAVARPAQWHSHEIIMHHCMVLHIVATFVFTSGWKSHVRRMFFFWNLLITWKIVRKVQKSPVVHKIPPKCQKATIH